MICFYKTTKTLSSITWRNPFSKVSEGGLRNSLFREVKPQRIGEARWLVHYSWEQSSESAWLLGGPLVVQGQDSGFGPLCIPPVTHTYGCWFTPRPWFCKAVGLREQHKHRGQAQPIQCCGNLADKDCAPWFQTTYAVQRISIRFLIWNMIPKQDTNILKYLNSYLKL